MTRPLLFLLALSLVPAASAQPGVPKSDRLSRSEAGSTVPETAAEVLDRVGESFERRMADVDNYAVVQMTSVAPLPVVLYFEREDVDGRTAFRQLSPSEVADREAEAAGRPTAEQIGGGLGELASRLGGLVPAGGAPSPAQPILDKLVDGVRGSGEILQNVGPFETRQDLADQLWQLDEFRERAELVGREVAPVSYCDDLNRCGPGNVVRSGDEEVFVLRADGLEDVDLGEGSEGYTLSQVTQWVLVAGHSGDYVPVRMRAVMRRGDQEVVVEQTSRQLYRKQNMLEPGFILNRIRGLNEAVTGLPEGVARDGAIEALTFIYQILINNGPPTQEQMAQWIRQATEYYHESGLLRPGAPD